MSKFNIVVPAELEPFRDVLGSHFDKVCNDVKSFIGREESANDGANVKSKLSRVSITAKCVLTSKEGHKLSLPLNNPLSILLRFGMEMTKIDEQSGNRVYKENTVKSNGLQAEIPYACKAWFKQMTTKTDKPETETVETQ